MKNKRIIKYYLSRIQKACEIIGMPYYWEDWAVYPITNEDGEITAYIFNISADNGYESASLSQEVIEMLEIISGYYCPYAA